MKKISVFILLFTCLLSMAQKKCDLVYGDLSSISDQDAIAVSINFDSLKFAGYGNEKEFIAKMKQRFEEKKTGGGDKWEANWKDKKTTLFERRFVELFYKHSGLDAMTTGYCFVLMPTKLYPGFDTEDATPKAYLSGEVFLIKISEPNKKLARIVFRNIPGEGAVADPTGGLRIGDTYAIAGKIVGKFVKAEIRKLKKEKGKAEK